MDRIGYKEYQSALATIKAYQKQCLRDLSEINENVNEHFVLQNSKLADRNLSGRTFSTLWWNGFGLNQFDSLVKDLANVSRFELLKCRGVGRKTMIEIDGLCEMANISMRP